MSRPALLAETTRRDVDTGQHVVESRHLGHLVVLDPDGRARALGDDAHLTFVRSAAKPFQAAACLEVLVPADVATPTAQEIAVAWGSHRAEPHHLAAVRRLLDRAGVDADALTCPPAGAAPPRRLQHNCSGKHALFALAGQALGVRRDELLDPHGPLQQRVLGHLAEVLGPPAAVAVDGCGAPAVAVPLRSLAAGFRSLVGEERYRSVREAGLTHPDHVGGTGRLESALLSRGVVAKPGAEAVFAAAWLDPSGGPWAFALKVEDGARRAGPVAAHGLLAALGVVARDVWSPDPVLGGGCAEGVVRPGTDVVRLAGEVTRT